MTCLLIINLFFAGFSSMTVTSRIGFAMARDKALPFSKFLHSVNSTTQTPNRLIGLVFVLDCLMCLLPLANPLAFTAVTSLTCIGYQISYAIPIFLRLTASRTTFKKSDFHLGRFSEPVGWIAVIWLVGTSIIFLFPTSFNDDGSQDKEIFNYTCVVVGAVAIIALIYWFLPAPLGARHFF